MSGRTMGQAHCIHIPIGQVYGYTKRPCPSPTHTRPERQGTGWRAGRPIWTSKPPTPGLRGSWNVCAVNNYQSLTEALNIWNIIHHATTSCPQNASQIVCHPGTQLMLGQHRQLVWRNLPRVSTLAGNRTQHLSFARWVRYPQHHRATVMHWWTME